MFGLRMNEVIGRWRKIHKELRNLCSSSSIITMKKSKRMRLGGTGSLNWGEEEWIQVIGGKKTTRKTKA
jgi:hypothetical protein